MKQNIFTVYTLSRTESLTVYS